MRFARWFGGALLVVAVLVQPACGILGGSCTAVGCDDTLDTEFTLATSAEALEDGQVSVCRNGDCLTSAITVRRSQGDAGPATVTCQPGTHDAPASVGCFARTPQALQVTYGFRPGRSAPIQGDRFEVRVTDAQGNVIAERSGEVHYESLTPNGKSCGPLCWHGTLPAA